MTNQKLSMLRIYIQRGDNRKSKTFFGRLFERPLSSFLIEMALKSGVQCAFLNHANVGFTKGAKGVSYDLGEIPHATMPICLELVASKDVLEAFLKDQATCLTSATLLLVEGVQLLQLGLKLEV